MCVCVFKIFKAAVVWLLHCGSGALLCALALCCLNSGSKPGEPRCCHDHVLLTELHTLCWTVWYFNTASQFVGFSNTLFYYEHCWNELTLCWSTLVWVLITVHGWRLVVLHLLPNRRCWSSAVAKVGPLSLNLSVKVPVALNWPRDCCLGVSLTCFWFPWFMLDHPLICASLSS